MRFLLLFLALHAAAACRAQSGSFKYPHAALSTTVDYYSGTPVPDPYRSLEADTLQTTRTWLDEELHISRKYFDRLIHKYELESQFRRNSYATFPSFFRSGKYYFSRGRHMDEPDASLFMHKKIGAAGEKLVDPASYTTGRSDRVNIGAFAVSEDDKYLAFSIGHRGSDWQEIHVKSLEPVRSLKDVLQHVKFSKIAWSGDGFYYMGYDHSGTNELRDPSMHATLYYHRLGTAQATDTCIYQAEQDSLARIWFDITPLGAYLIVYDTHEENGQRQHIVAALSLKGPSAGQWHTIVRSAGGDYQVLGLYKERFLVKTTLGASRGRLLLFNPEKENDADELVPEQEQILHEACMAGDKIICTYLDDLAYTGVVFDTSGMPVDNMKYPFGCSVSDFTSSPADSIAIFYYHSFLHPPVVYAYNTKSLTLSRIAQTEIAFDHKLFTVEKVHYRSSDGTRIPMMIAYKKGLKMDGTAPTVLYGYGGNGIVMTPFFSSSFISHLQNGGIVALPCIRGGNEFGEDWHRHGARAEKQQVFDDFAAAASYLFKEHYTSKERLALMGGSNGGLLVAAVVNQHPDICKVAIAERGVYDMLRFQHYTIGHAWQDEYGSSNDAAQFNYLYRYSPLHNVQQGAAYPAMLITTADHDDRVVPLHAYKYVAALQDHTAGPLPVLLHVERNAGHQTASLEEEALIYSFIYEQMGIKPRQVGMAY